MKLFVEKRELSINDLINRLPPMDRKCKSCDGNGVGPNGTCEKCVKGKSKVDYYAIFREIKKLEEFIEPVLEIKNNHGKPTIKYDITTKGATWYIDNNPTLDVTDLVNVLVKRAREDNKFKIFKKEIKKENKKHIETHRIKRKIGFNSNDVIKYYENKVLGVSREFISPINFQRSFNKLEYFIKNDLSLFRKSFPILNNLCKNKFMEYGSIEESVKSIFTTTQFEKLFLEMTSTGIFKMYSKNNNLFFGLSHMGLIVFYHILKEPKTKTSLNYIKNYGAYLLPRLFTNKIFKKLSTKIKKDELFEIFLGYYFYDKLVLLDLFNQNQTKYLRLMNAQEPLITTYRSIIFVLYMEILLILDLKIKEELPNFKLKKLDDTPRIPRIFRDFYYSGYRSERDEGKEPSDHELLEKLKRNLKESKVNPKHLIFIMDKYQELVYSLLEFDELIYGDDIEQESGYVPNVTDFLQKFEESSSVFEFRSWLFLKSRHPEICEDVMNENKELLSWYNKWEDEIKKFEKQNVSSLE